MAVPKVLKQLRYVLICPGVRSLVRGDLQLTILYQMTDSVEIYSNPFYCVRHNFLLSRSVHAGTIEYALCSKSQCWHGILTQRC